jgi:exodeoxyribonuclease VII large subunit
MTTNTRIDLRVPYAEKDQAKVHGAQWDSENRTWYAPPGTDLQNLKRWLPNGVLEQTPDPITPSLKQTEKGIALTELLNRVKGVIEGSFPKAEWVRAEVSELRGKNGHLYLTLCERNQTGDILAQTKGIIWRTKAEAITAKFELATGGALKSDIKILCLARVRFDPLYGLDLNIDDVDPSYTLGDLAAKLARIRENLQESGLYQKNKRLPAPVEFVRVAVISPETSAGLGDFRQEGDRLQTANLCEFALFPASFQGVEAPSSIQSAVLQALTFHQQHRLDALVIIRGGGSVTDLAWLNDLELAKLLCQSPVPVYTGIGHERDNTILDEIAHTRFDTPSKVALHIKTTIKDNAFGALESWERINALVARIVIKEKSMLATQVDRIETGARSIIRRVESDQESFVKLIQTATTAQIQAATVALETDHRRVVDGVHKTLIDAQLGMTHFLESITQRTQVQLENQRSEIDRLVHTLTLKAQSRIDAAGRDLDQIKTQVGRDADRMVTKAADDLTKSMDLIESGIVSVTDTARKDIENFARIVIGLGPQSTLQRGFAIARDDEDKPLTSCEAAMNQTTFQVEFRDGRVAVKNMGITGGNDERRA